MMMHTEEHDYLHPFFNCQRFAVLATEGKGQPYQSLVGFASSEDLSFIVFATVRNTRKFSNLLENPRVSLLIDDRQNADSDFEKAAAVTVTGLIEVADKEQRTFLSRMLLKKLPKLTDFIASPNCELIRLSVEQYVIVSNFQQVRIITLK